MLSVTVLFFHFTKYCVHTFKEHGQFCYGHMQDSFAIRTVQKLVKKLVKLSQSYSEIETATFI